MELNIELSKKDLKLKNLLSELDEIRTFSE